VPTSGAVRFVSSSGRRQRAQRRRNRWRQASRAYGKTVWSWPSLLRSSLGGGGTCVNRRGVRDFREGEGGQQELGSRESTAYAVKPLRREGRVIWLHLYAAVRFPCATSSRSGPRVPAGTRPSLHPLGQEGGRSKARAKRAARLRNCVCESNASWKNDAAASCSVIASAAKQPSPPPPRDSGLFRSARNDDGEAGARVSPGLRRARGRDGSRSSDGRGCARSWCRAVRSPRSRPGRDTAGT
jgi:hypothetical protein